MASLGVCLLLAAAAQGLSYPNLQPHTQPLVVIADSPYSVARYSVDVPLLMVDSSALTMIRGAQISAVSPTEPLVTCRANNKYYTEATPAVQVVLKRPLYVSPGRQSVPFPGELSVLYGGLRMGLPVGALVAPVPHQRLGTPQLVRVVYAIPSGPLPLQYPFYDPFAYSSNEQSYHHSQMVPVAPFQPNFAPAPYQPAGLQELYSPAFYKPSGSQELSLPAFYKPSGSQELSSPVFYKPSGSQELSLPAFYKPSGSQDLYSPALYKPYAPAALYQPSAPQEEANVIADVKKPKPVKANPQTITVLDFPSAVATPENLYYQPPLGDSELGNRGPPEAIAPAGIVQSTQPVASLETFLNSKESPVLNALREQAEQTKEQEESGVEGVKAL